MQVLIYSKQKADQDVPILADLDPVNKMRLIEEMNHQGTLCLMTGLVFESIRKQIEKAGYIDCGEKNEKIDLKRAFRFDEKGDRNKSKWLKFSTSNIGAFKRGLSAFYEKHYTDMDPSCLILVPEAIFESLRCKGAKPLKKSGKPSGAERDSLFKLMVIPESSPLIKKLEHVYIGTSIEVQHTRALIYRASLTDSPVLILGESGTGKDVIASQIYENSNSSKGRFYRVNCSALPETLLEGELFGYVKGIFTGAGTDKTGLLQAATGGTIFLDEIGDLSLPSQVKILHAVENKVIRKIGSNESIPIDVRIITATNRNLDAMMKQGTFRDDLYYRISTFRINAHPLREHPEDIPLLAKAYWAKKNRKSELSASFLEYLKSYQWPGNVRELNSLLNSLVDYFGDIPPSQAHVEAIRSSRQETLVQSKTREGDDPAQIMKIKSQNVLISVQNILRSIKIEMRPFIYGTPGQKNNPKISDFLKKFIRRQVAQLDELCLEPTFFVRMDIFKKTARYRFLLDSSNANFPETSEQLNALWIHELQQLDDDINQGIMEELWGKIDM